MNADEARRLSLRLRAQHSLPDALPDVGLHRAGVAVVLQHKVQIVHGQGPEGHAGAVPPGRRVLFQVNRLGALQDLQPGGPGRQPLRQGPILHQRQPAGFQLRRKGGPPCIAEAKLVVFQHHALRSGAADPGPPPVKIQQIAVPRRVPGNPLQQRSFHAVPPIRVSGLSRRRSRRDAFMGFTIPYFPRSVQPPSRKRAGRLCPIDTQPDLC